jgi:NNP family nitrate/nitrite transporter-like MFS transporter
VAAVQSFNASLWRPFSGYVSDIFKKRKWTPWPFLTQHQEVSPRIHWVFTAMVSVTVMMILLTLAGLSGNLTLSVVTLAVLGFTIAFGTGSNFGLTPVLFRKNPGVATGFIGGISTIGGIIYPLIFGRVANIHMGYAVIAIFMFIPFMYIFIVAFKRGQHVDVDAGVGGWKKYGVASPLGASEGEPND